MDGVKQANVVKVDLATEPADKEAIAMEPQAPKRRKKHTSKVIADGVLGSFHSLIVVGAGYYAEGAGPSRKAVEDDRRGDGEGETPEKAEEPEETKEEETPRQSHPGGRSLMPYSRRG